MNRLVIAASVIALLAACDGADSISNTGNETSDVNYMDMVWPVFKEGETAEQYELDVDPFRENYLVVIDMSGSMNESTCSGSFPTKSDAAKSVLKDWVGLINADAALGVVAFDKSGTSVRLETAPNNHRNFIDIVDGLQADSGTPLSSAVALGYKELERRAKMQNGIGIYRMVVVTDGIHSKGYDPTNNVNWIIDNTPIEMHTIGFCINESALNQPGRAMYTSADNPEALFAGLSNALAEVPTFTLTNFE